MKIVLTQEKIFFILDSPASDTIEEDASEEKRATYKMWKDDSVTVKCIILTSMNNKLQRQHEDMDIPSMLINLKSYIENKAKLLDMRYLNSCSVSE